MQKIIYDLNKLNGTCYFEILPSKYKGNCWNEESIYLKEESFGLLMKAIEKVFPKFDYYAFNEIDSQTWSSILKELNLLKNVLANYTPTVNLKDHVYFIFELDEIEFMNDLDHNIQSTIALIDDFSKWIYEKTDTTDYISILGI